MVSGLSADANLIVQWARKWLVSFNTSKTKLLSFHHHHNSPDLPTILMDRTQLKEIDCFDKHLGLHFTPNLKQDTYITSIPRIVSKFYHSRNYLISNALLDLYKSQIHPKMEYGSQI